MKIELYYISRDKNYHAEAVFKDGKCIVKKGSRIKTVTSPHFGRVGGKANKCRQDSNIVGADGVTIKDCEFNSVSIAAQFVSGSVLNGKAFWHCKKDGKQLKYHLVN